jgi:hypothetical protein
VCPPQPSSLPRPPGTSSPTHGTSTASAPTRPPPEGTPPRLFRVPPKLPDVLLHPRFCVQPRSRTPRLHPFPALLVTIDLH